MVDSCSVKERRCCHAMNSIFLHWLVADGTLSHCAHSHDIDGLMLSQIFFGKKLVLSILSHNFRDSLGEKVNLHFHDLKRRMNDDKNMEMDIKYSALFVVLIVSIACERFFVFASTQIYTGYANY
jgi:hypothetical protein